MWWYVLGGVVAVTLVVFAWAACKLAGADDDARGYPRG